MGFASKRNFYGCPQGNRLGQNSSSNLQGWSWRAASAQHHTKNWEIHWYPQTSVSKAKTRRLTRMPTAQKAWKERDCTQMSVANKDRTDHKCWWQTKNGCPNQASKQLKQNEKKKMKKTTTHSWNHFNKPNGCLPAIIRWRKTKQNTKQNRKHHQITSLIEYCLQQRSGRLQP